MKKQSNYFVKLVLLILSFIFIFSTTVFAERVVDLANREDNVNVLYRSSVDIINLDSSSFEARETQAALLDDHETLIAVLEMLPNEIGTVDEILESMQGIIVDITQITNAETGEVYTFIGSVYDSGVPLLSTHAGIIDIDNSMMDNSVSMFGVSRTTFNIAAINSFGSRRTIAVDLDWTLDALRRSMFTGIWWRPIRPDGYGNVVPYADRVRPNGTNAWVNFYCGTNRWRMGRANFNIGHNGFITTSFTGTAGWA